MMKAMGGAKRGALGKMAQAFGIPGAGGGMPQPSPEQIAALQKQYEPMPGAPSAPAPPAAAPKPVAPPPRLVSSAPKLPGLGGAGLGAGPGAAPGKLPGLGGGLLGGLNPFGKKK
jgi:signal recognition particle subunit SRP54